MVDPLKLKDKQINILKNRLALIKKAFKDDESYLESEVKYLNQHIDMLKETIEGWQNVAKGKDEIIEKYQDMIKNL